MSSIKLDLDPQGRRILSCACGTIEIAPASQWQEFTIEALGSDLVVVTCVHCERHVRLASPDSAEPELPQSTL